jgi:CheY-like chemotaxis protein
MNMQLPDTPLQDGESPATLSSATAMFENKPHVMIEGSNIAVNGNKRKRSTHVSWSFGGPTKRRESTHSPTRSVSPRSGSNQLHHVPTDTKRRPSSNKETDQRMQDADQPRTFFAGNNSLQCEPQELDALPTPPLRQSRIRDLIPIVIHEALRVGGRPDSSVADPTPFGEKLEVRTRSSSGHASYQIIDWSVQPDVPEVVPIDERDLSKLISCVFLNAIKFTENGKVAVVTSLSQSLRSLRINIIDNGAGIPKDFVPELFKPFSREDDSLTRTREGLGLGLLVAKGLARKLGGDLMLVHTETSGQSRGSEFEIKIPIGITESGSRRGTPLPGSPTPSYSSPPVPKLDTLCTTSSQAKPTLADTVTSAPQPNSQLEDDAHHLSNSYFSGRRNSSPRRGLSSKPSNVELRDRNAFDRNLAQKHPLIFLVAEDNKINRRLLVNMLAKLGYKDIYEAFDGREAVRVMNEIAASSTVTPSAGSNSATDGALKPVDVILMDLWMPEMDGYEATETILEMFKSPSSKAGFQSIRLRPPTILAISADVTDKAISRATAVGMEGFMTKPYKLLDLQRLIEEVCERDRGGHHAR